MNPVLGGITAAAVTVAVIAVRRYQRLAADYAELETEVEEVTEHEIELLNLFQEMPPPPGYSAVEMEGWLWGWHRWRVRVAHTLTKHGEQVEASGSGFRLPRPLR